MLPTVVSGWGGHRGKADHAVLGVLLPRALQMGKQGLGAETSYTDMCNLRP